VRGDGVDRFGIVGTQEFQSLIGKDDAEAPGRAGGVLLVEIDLRGGMPPFPQIGEIEAARTASAPWTNRVGLVLAVGWPIQCGVGLVVSERL